MLDLVQRLRAEQPLFGPRTAGSVFISALVDNFDFHNS
jgi:hypothetical protein